MQLKGSGWPLKPLDGHLELLDGHAGPPWLLKASRGYLSPLKGHIGPLDGHLGLLDGHLVLLDGHFEPLDVH